MVYNEWVFMGSEVFMFPKNLAHCTPFIYSWSSRINEANNRSFPSCFLPLCQNESKCETFRIWKHSDMKMSFTHKFIQMQIKLFSIWKISHLDSFWNSLIVYHYNYSFHFPEHIAFINIGPYYVWSWTFLLDGKFTLLNFVLCYVIYYWL